VDSFHYDPSDSLSLADNEIYCITQDNQGSIWIGTFAGLNKFNAADSTFFALNHSSDMEGASEHPINSIYCDRQGYLWAGTDNGGLLQIDPQKNQLIKQYTKKDLLPDNVIYGILEDKEHNLWFSSNKGITKAIKQETSGNLSFINYNSSNWLNTDSYNIGAFAKGPDEILYFGSFEGVTYFDIDQVKGNNYIPPVYITDFQLFFKPVEISYDKSTPLSQNISQTKSIRLKHDQNVIKFGFTALNYIQTEKNSFAFRMKGLEENWNFTTESREAQYLYLPPGEYTFQVKAANNDGIWNEEGASVDIVINPPFTQTLWFYFIIVAGITIIIFWIMNLRTKRLRATRDKLEKQVQTRTKELRKTNQDLNNALDDLKKTQAQLIDSEKMASLGQLTAGVAHEINNPINFVSGNVVPLRRDIGDILEVLKQYEKVIKELDISGKFDEVEALKKKLDFEFVITEIDNLLDGIGEGASRTAEIVKGLRNFSRLDEHELKYTNINEGLDSTILILHNKLKERIRISKEYGTFKDIMCYPGQMNQVFMNVLNNAQEAIEGSGEIRIKTWLEDHQVFISIKDNGRGMTEQVKKKIFDPFYTTKDVGQGTGLGLSISFGIIEKHKGKIKINSSPGKGTEFIISIPDNLL
jgi:signal transduction histidine kinase